MQPVDSLYCMVVELGSSVRTIDCANSQRKNAANKLQDSGLATVVVYHIRHRVLHHIDSKEHVDPDPVFRVSKDHLVLSKPYRSVGLILRILGPLRLETFSAATHARARRYYFALGVS